MRYLKVSILIGLLVSGIVAALFEYGAFRQLDLGLGNFMGLDESSVAQRIPQLVLIVLLAFGVAWTTVDIPRTLLKGVVAVGVLAQVLTATWVLNLFGVFFSPFAPTTAILLSFALGIIYSRTDAGRRKKVVRQVFGDRISKRTFYTLVNQNIPLPLEGELKGATVVICEIFNHDHLVDMMPVQDYVAMNNSFLRNAADFLVERGAYLDECDGESLRVIFGTPLPMPNHATVACDAAYALAAHLDQVNEECNRVWKQMFDFRIGINSGELVVAAYGSRRLGAFSAAGEPMEWARRLCSANRHYGSRVLIGSQTHQLAEGEMEVRPLELVQRHPEDRHREEIYELLSPKDGLSEEDLARRDLFWKGIVYYRERRWEEARAHFLLAAPEGRDQPLEYYLHRVDQLRGGDPELAWKEAQR
ncbi:MAG: adenylate/guanylate cyclase domain-containing protein [Chthoniobacteraceae bacterium]